MYREPTEKPNFEFFDSDDKKKRAKQAEKDYKLSKTKFTNTAKQYIEKDEHLNHPQLHGISSAMK